MTDLGTDFLIFFSESNETSFEFKLNIHDSATFFSQLE